VSSRPGGGLGSTPRDAEPWRTSPEEALARASRLRRARRWAEAARAYAAVRRREDAGPARYVAAVAEGQLRLDHLSDPSGALAAFRAARALRPGGALDPEIRLGEADSYAALGRARAARAAWRALVDAHPESPSARAARARLEGDGR
jgi:hypothetical protein